MLKLLFCFIILVNAGPPPAEHANKAAIRPKVARVNLITNVTDPSITRDSCGSVRIGERALWTCRDTETWNVALQKAELPLIANTASWTDFDTDGIPKIRTGPVGASSDGSNPILLMYGGHPTTTPSFYPVLHDECPKYGVCSDNTRWAIWPNSPPMVTTGADGRVTGYTWIPKAHLDVLTPLIQEPARTLYKLTYMPTSKRMALPSVSVVIEEFWIAGEIGYGDYGNLIVDGMAYLYGQTSGAKGTALAKVPVASVEDKSKYHYYVNGAWTSKTPRMNDAAAVVPNAGAGGQGTFFHSKAFAHPIYIWIGQAAMSATADFYISTAPAAEGPWIDPYRIYRGTNGDSAIAGGYSLQAHPALLESESQKGIYSSWTKQFASTTYGGYVTPLVYMEWQ